MDGIGAEVGHKMRSAIKAKLLELSCYVDDELPDYIMVMVANKRTKSQMNEDLNLFLSTKTSTFVDWLHIVLKKLKEVTVTNAELYKKATKRKTVDLPDVKFKKERKDLILDKGKKEKNLDMEMEENHSLVDSPSVGLSEQRKITIVNESSTNNNDDVFDIPLLSQVNNISNEKDLQSIEKKIRSVKSRLGLMVDSDLEEELPEIKVEKDAHKNSQQKLTYRTVQIHNGNDDQSSNKKEETNETETETTSKIASANSVRLETKPEHKRIIFEEEAPKKASILKRLGNRPAGSLATKSGRTRISLSEFRKEEEPFLKYFSDNKNGERARDRRKRDEHVSERSTREHNTRRNSPEERKRDRSRERHRDRSSDIRSSTKKESILSRLGVMSKVFVPPKEPDEPEFENELKMREVRSMVQVKPRVIPSGTSQPNKNLLLKAMAEAQRSIAQAPYVGKIKANSLKADIVRESEKNVEEVLPHVRKFSQKEKNKLKNLLLSHATQDKTGCNDSDGKTEEYIPKPIKETPKETPKYIPSCRLSEESEDDIKNQQFIVTLDGIERKPTNSESRLSVKDRLDGKVSAPSKPSVKSRLDSKKSRSPIIFDKNPSKMTTKVDTPDRLPTVHPPLSLKNKERCKYWPNCRHGDKCEFVHPIGLCEKFPHCKFGDKCLFIHPTCKFGSSCTKRDCPFNHTTTVKLVSRPVPKASIGHVSSGLQLCKFFPSCANSSCQFYHPKPCKYGKYCKNQSECNFSHHFISNKNSLIWRSK